jgi:hypothetical protein
LLAASFLVLHLQIATAALHSVQCIFSNNSGLLLLMHNQETTPAGITNNSNTTNMTAEADLTELWVLLESYLANAEPGYPTPIVNQAEINAAMGNSSLIAEEVTAGPWSTYNGPSNPPPSP